MSGENKNPFEGREGRTSYPNLHQVWELVYNKTPRDNPGKTRAIVHLRRQAVDTELVDVKEILDQVMAGAPVHYTDREISTLMRALSKAATRDFARQGRSTILTIGQEIKDYKKEMAERARSPSPTEGRTSPRTGSSRGSPSPR